MALATHTGGVSSSEAAVHAWRGAKRLAAVVRVAAGASGRRVERPWWYSEAVRRPVGENSSGSDLAALLFDGANRMACARMEKQAKRGRGGVKKGQSGPGSEAGAAAVGGEDRQWPKRRRAAAPLFWAEVEEGTVGRPSCKKEKG